MIDRENVPVTIRYDPSIEMKQALLDRVAGWVTSAFERGLVPIHGGTCEGGFRFDGIDYLLTCWLGDKTSLRLEVFVGKQGGAVQ